MKEEKKLSQALIPLQATAGKSLIHWPKEIAMASRGLGDFSKVVMGDK